MNYNEKGDELGQTLTSVWKACSEMPVRYPGGNFKKAAEHKNLEFRMKLELWHIYK
jgi:hypothetical protein